MLDMAIELQYLILLQYAMLHQVPARPVYTQWWQALWYKGFLSVQIRGKMRKTD